MRQQIRDTLKKIYLPLLQGWGFSLRYKRTGDADSWVAGEDDLLVIRIRSSGEEVVIDNNWLSFRRRKYIVPAFLWRREDWDEFRKAVEDCISIFILMLLRDFLIAEGWAKTDIDYGIDKKPYLHIKSLNVNIIFKMLSDSPEWLLRVLGMPERRVIWEIVKRKKVSPLLYFPEIKEVLRATYLEGV